MPDEWRRSILVPIYKNKGDIQSCTNYRGIKLMSHTMKLWERVIEHRLRAITRVSTTTTISIKVAKFLHWLATPNTTLLLYQGLGPAMLGHQRRPTIGGVLEVLLKFIKFPETSKITFFVSKTQTSKMIFALVNISL